MSKLPPQDKAPSFLASLKKTDNVLNDIANGHLPFVEKDGIEVYGNPSPSFSQYIANEQQRLTQAERSFMSCAGIRVGVGCLNEDITPEITGNSHEPTLFDERSHYNEAGGVFLPSKNMVCVTEKVWGIQRPAPIPPPDGVVIPHIEEPTFRLDNATCPRRAYYHECGHAIFHNASPELWNKDSFLEAHRLDMEALGGPDAAREKGFAYYIQDVIPGRGADEGFAESYALIKLAQNPIDDYEYPIPPPPIQDIANSDAPPTPPEITVKPIMPKERVLNAPLEANSWPRSAAWMKQFVETFDAIWKNKGGIFALEKKRNDIVGEWLAKGGNVNAKDSKGNPLLTLAIREHNTEVIQMLLRHSKIDINATDEWGMTAVDVATTKRDLNTLDDLLKRRDVKNIDRACEMASRNARMDESKGRWNSTAAQIESRLLHYKEKKINNAREKKFLFHGHPQRRKFNHQPLIDTACAAMDALPKECQEKTLTDSCSGDTVSVRNTSSPMALKKQHSGHHHRM